MTPINNDGVLQFPSYLSKTHYGESLLNRFKYQQWKKDNNGLTGGSGGGDGSGDGDGLSKMGTRLSSSGLMGSVPGRYMNLQYNDELIEMIGERSRRGDGGDVIVGDDGDGEGDNNNDDDNNDEDEDEDDDEGHDVSDEDKEDDDDDEGDNRMMKHNKRRFSRSSSTMEAGIWKYPLPTRWEFNSNNSIHITNNGLQLKVDQSQRTSSSQKTYDYQVTKANQFIPVNCGVFYFEVEIISVLNNNVKGNCDVCIGMMSINNSNINKMPGLEIGSYGYNGFDGTICCNQNGGRKFSRKFGLNSIIGCGINFSKKEIFYTKDGVFLGVAFKDVNFGSEMNGGKGMIPIIGLKNGNAIMTNFGNDGFIFDIDGYVEMEKMVQSKKILNVNTDCDLSKIMENLVSSYFDHLGYIEISKSFKEEIAKEEIEEDLDQEDQDDDKGVNFNKIKEEENLKAREQIRRLIVDGDIDSAIRLTERRFPNVFKENEEALFKLECNRFLQLIKKEKIDEALMYGQSLRLKYKGNDKFDEYLNDIFSLLAYEDPLLESEFGFLLKNEELYKISDELNSEILKSLGKSSFSELERLVKHTQGLLEYMNGKEELDTLLITNDDFGLN